MNAVLVYENLLGSASRCSKIIHPKNSRAFRKRRAVGSISKHCIQQTVDYFMSISYDRSSTALGSSITVFEPPE